MTDCPLAGPSGPRAGVHAPLAVLAKDVRFLSGIAAAASSLSPPVLEATTAAIERWARMGRHCIPEASEGPRMGSQSNDRPGRYRPGRAERTGDDERTG